MTDATATPKHTNRLVHETSPYLLQHAHNPVDWYPWGEDALGRARAEGKLILLSIGYSACHWCHVMERESFENESTASLMNEHYVNIKVDREERPDLDDIYMAATVAMNQGHGGWPMTVFLTPDLEPVFAGTYFPPDDGYGRVGFPRVLTEIARMWSDDRERVSAQASDFVQQLRQSRGSGPSLAVGEDELRAAGSAFAADFDSQYGGFGPAPKFPPATGLTLLLRLHRRYGDEHYLEMVRKTLDGMANGGMYDQIAGGFSRYSTDERWLVPHFEKMLYDNALLAVAYLEAYQVTGETSYRRIATEILDYVLREMTSDDGGFYSATDADSEGVEGKFFVWDPEEIAAVIGEEDARLFNAYYDITDGGNWEGKNIPNVRRKVEDVARQFEMDPAALLGRLEGSRTKVYEARLQRVKPGLDDKILTSWNGMMIAALAEGFRVLRDDRYLAAARHAADFVLKTLVRPDGGLLRTTRAGKAHLDAYLEDYAHLSEGLLDLYEASGERRYLEESSRLAERMVVDFGDADGGGFFNTARDHERLVLRYREGTDGATPAPNAVAATVLVRLASHLDRPDLRETAVRAIRAYGSKISRFPRGFAKSLVVVDFLLDGPVELAIVGRPGAADREALEEELAKHFLPNRIQAIGDPDASISLEGLPLLEGKTLVHDSAALFVCRDFACAAPVTSPAAVSSALASNRESGNGGVRSIAVKRAGRATADGTLRFAARFFESSSASTGQDSPLGYTTLGATELTASRLGFGAYRVEDLTPSHRESLTRAIQSGVNVIDTSTNYTEGRSERLVGNVVNDLVQNEEVWRDELIVVTKIGYLQGTNYDLAVDREQKGSPFPEVVKVDDGLWHCFHPVFLADQLDRSLDRLELETVDVCLIHNPEYFLTDAARRGIPLEDARVDFYRRLQAAFEYLEESVASGAIQWYGVSSNTLTSPSHQPDATSITRMMEAASKAGGAAHHFAVVQVPLNLMESGALFERNTGLDNDKTVLDVAVEHNVAVLVNRPLNAFGPMGLIRLADVSIDDEPIDLNAQVEKVAALETTFREGIATTLSVPPEALDPKKFFDWSGQLAGLAAQPITLEQWSHAASQVQVAVAQIVQALDTGLQGDVAAQWAAWRDQYFTELGRLLGEIRRRAAERAALQVAAITHAIDPRLPEDRRSASLSQKALWIAAHTPGVSVVLNGMRAPDYVRDALVAMGWPSIDSVEDVYSAVATVELPA